MQAGINDLVCASFDEATADLRDMKLRRGLHEIHLIALKADFELYLNRVLTVVWMAHFESLAAKAPARRDVSLRELAEAAIQGGSGRDLVIDMVVPAHDLSRLVASLREATDIRVPKDLPAFDFRKWSQIQVAFEVRHLIEHRDGRIDSEFRTHVRHFWPNSSWGRRGRLPSAPERITVDEADVVSTYEAMREAVRLVTDALVLWDSRQPSSGITDAADVAQLGDSPANDS
jgi:hypothetical protein